MDAKQQRRERLEVPDVSPLEHKLLVDQPPPSTSTSRPTIGPVQRSSVLQRLQGFLPQLQAANQQLEHAMQGRAADEFDIEAVDEDAEHIEMDLACGVLELKDDSAVTAAERVLTGLAAQLQPTHTNPHTDSQSDTDTDSDDDTDTSSDHNSDPMDTDTHIQGLQGTANQAVNAATSADTDTGTGTHAEPGGSGNGGGVGGVSESGRVRQGQGLSDMDAGMQTNAGDAGSAGRRAKVKAKRKNLIQELN